MNMTELADKLNGEYPLYISKELIEQAKAAGLVIVYGASDDLMEFRGAIHDEFGCWEGGTVRVDAKGVLPNRDDIDDDEALKDFFAREPSAVEIDALWCDEDEYSWTYRTDIPNATFIVTDHGAPYCRGIVFSLTDLNQPA